MSSITELLNNLANRLSFAAEAMARNNTGVTAAAEQMNGNMVTIAAASEEISTKVNMVAAVSEEMDSTITEIAANSDQVPDHHQCDFGKWYDNAPAELQKLPAFKEVDIYHERVHATVGKVIAAHNDGKSDLATRELDAFEAARKSLFAQLDELYLS